MKTIFINIPNNEKAIQRALDIANVVFNEELAYIPFDPEKSLKTQVMAMMDCDYYFTSGDLWNLKNDAEKKLILDIDKMANTYFGGYDSRKQLYFPCEYIFEKEYWDEITIDPDSEANVPVKRLRR